MIHKHIKLKRNAWPQRDFPAGPEFVCACVRGWWWKSEVGWDQGDGISELQWGNFPASEETLTSHPRLDFTNIHSTPVLCPFYKTRLDIFGVYPKFTDVFGVFFIWPAHLVIIWRPGSFACVCLSVFFP